MNGMMIWKLRLMWMPDTFVDMKWLGRETGHSKAAITKTADF